MNESLLQEQINELAIRPLHRDDGPAIYRLLHDSQQVGDLPFIPGTELTQILAWLAKRDPGIHRYVALDDRGIAGFLILTQYMRPRLNHSGNIVMATRSHHQYMKTRQAIMTTALDLADNWLNLNRLEIEVASEDRANIDYFESIGFIVEGTRLKVIFRERKWIDQVLMARLRVHPQWLKRPAKTDFIQSSKKSGSPQRPVESIEIRPSELGDANAFYEMLRDPAICRTTLQLPSQEIWQTEERLKDSKPWLHRFTAVADGKIVGSIALVQSQSPGHGHIARIGMKVRSEYWGRGIGSKLMQTVTDLVCTRSSAL